AYKQLIADWNQVLPAQSVCLQVPLVMPNDADQPWARQQQGRARRMQHDVKTQTINDGQTDNH
ncbi:MAG: glycoside hydrolase family 1 protein, partial [Cytophagaceae bacterium]